MSANETTSDGSVRIKKYANRRLYNTATSTYVTLDDLAEMLKEGDDFVVHDAKTGEDITHSVLTQIIFEQEAKGENLLPIPFLRQLIRFYGDSMQDFVPSFLEISLEQLAQDQGKLRERMAKSFGASPVGLMEDQVRQNMAMFNEAMKMFTPFVPATAGPENDRTAEEKPARDKKPKPAAKTKRDELSVLKDQIDAMQAQLNTLSNGKKD
ncbi:PhbF [hydrothermal vent metagenome]|uniref:PhbF n=1 Tax=hydrothermal vent metagenome TaxID=652676 RepID=A0A3B0UF67_9ZZZZ